MHQWFLLRDQLRGHGQSGLVGAVRALLPRLGRKGGIEKRVHAHGLRHPHRDTDPNAHQYGDADADADRHRDTDSNTVEFADHYLDEHAE